MNESGPEHRGTITKTGLMARVVEVPWTCRQTGDCCRMVPEVVMTKQEQALLDARYQVATRPLVWHDHPTDGFVRLEAKPCPFLAGNICLVHEIRPYNCRRFMCGRVDVQQESLEMNPEGQCYNSGDRIRTSLRFFEYSKAHERRAQKEWAVDHGWKKPPRWQV